MAVLALQVLDEGINILIVLLIQRRLLLGDTGSVVRSLLLVEMTARDVGRERRGGARGRARGRMVRHDAINELGARGGCVDVGSEKIGNQLGFPGGARVVEKVEELIPFL